MDKRLLEILVCPVTKTPLIYDKANQELVSVAAQLAYPIKDQIAVLSKDQARLLTDDQVAEYRGLA